MGPCFRKAGLCSEWASRPSTAEGREGHWPEHFLRGRAEPGIKCGTSAAPLSISSKILLQVSSLACPPSGVWGTRDTRPIRYSSSSHEDSPKHGRDPTLQRSRDAWAGWNAGVTSVVGRDPQVIVKWLWFRASFLDLPQEKSRARHGGVCPLSQHLGG